MTTEVRVPTLGESVTTATVATWFKKPGEMVAVDEMLCELETDKVTVEVPSPIEGTLSDIIALEGDSVGIDALLATITEIKSTKATEAEQLPAKANDVGIKNNMEGVTFVSVPTLGESVTEATVSTWFKSIGDVIARDEMLCELETDKVSVEVSAPTSGILSEILKPEGTTVDANAKLAVINRSGGIDTLATTPVHVSNHKEKDIEPRNDADIRSINRLKAHSIREDRQERNTPAIVGNNRPISALNCITLTGLNRRLTVQI